MDLLIINFNSWICAAILATWILLFIERKNRMATEADLEQDVSNLSVKVDGLIADIGTLQAQVTDLQAQLGAGTPVTQAQLDSLDASLKEILAKHA